MEKHLDYMNICLRIGCSFYDNKQDYFSRFGSKIRSKLNASISNIIGNKLVLLLYKDLGNGMQEIDTITGSPKRFAII